MFLPAKIRQNPRGLRPCDSLTESERLMIGLLALGLTNQQIAGAMRVSLSYIGHGLMEVFNKLGLDTRLEVAVWWAERKIK